MWLAIRTASDRRPSEVGSAAVDFVLVGSLVTLLFLAVIQLGIDFHVRNVLTASVAEGARYAANADVADADVGAQHANALISRSLGPAYAHAVAAPDADIDGAPVVTVEAEVRLPLVAWFLPVGPSVHVSGHALIEPGWAGAGMTAAPSWSLSGSRCCCSFRFSTSFSLRSRCSGRRSA